MPHGSTSPAPFRPPRPGLGHVELLFGLANLLAFSFLGYGALPLASAFIIARAHMLEIELDVDQAVARADSSRRLAQHAVRLLVTLSASTRQGQRLDNLP